jgi:AsmA protein
MMALPDQVPGPGVRISRRYFMKNKPLVIAGVVVAVLLLIVLALPLFINANKFKPKLETQLTSALGRKVTIGNISLALFSGGVSVSDVAIADDPAFSSSPFLTAKELTVGVELMPLIFSKRLEVRSITLDSPDVALIHAPNGTWNYSSLGNSGASNGAAKPAPAQSAPPASGSDDDAAANLTVQKLEIKNGKIVVSGTGAKAAKPSTYSDVNLEASDISYTSSFPFKLSATGPGNSAFKVDGKAGPIDKADSSLTPLTATLDVQHLDLATTGFIDASTGIAGVMDFKGNLNSDGKTMTSKGTVTANKFKMSAAGSPSSVPVTVDYTTDYALKSQTGNLTQGDIHIGKAFQQVTGTYDMSGDSTKINMKVHAANMPLGDLEGFLPAIGVVLPSGSKLQGGTLSADLAANGPVDKLTIAGPVNIANTELAGFSLSQKLGALSAFTGLGKGGSSTGTQIQQLSAQIKNDPGGTQFSSLNLVLPSIGTVTGQGTVSASGQLNMHMAANLAGGAGALTSVAGLASGGGGGALGGALSSFTGGGQSNAGKGGSGGGIPFSITGTTSNPVVTPDVAGLAGGLAKSGLGAGAAMGKGGAGTAGAAASALGGLLGKRKP